MCLRCIKDMLEIERGAQVLIVMNKASLLRTGIPDMLRRLPQEERAALGAGKLDLLWPFLLLCPT